MIKSIPYYLLTVTGICFLFLSASGQKDSITYNSTCVNYKIAFNASVFDRVDFPQKVAWNFGDPASGIYNTAGIKLPTHLYASPGDYTVSLLVVNAGDTIRLTDTIHVIVPITFDFGPDIYLCEKGDTSLTAPSIPGAVYQWNDDSLTYNAGSANKKDGRLYSEDRRLRCYRFYWHIL